MDQMAKQTPRGKKRIQLKCAFNAQKKVRWRERECAREIVFWIAITFVPYRVLLYNTIGIVNSSWKSQTIMELVLSVAQVQ